LNSDWFSMPPHLQMLPLRCLQHDKRRNEITRDEKKGSITHSDFIRSHPATKIEEQGETFPSAGLAYEDTLLVSYLNQLFQHYHSNISCDTDCLQQE
jgi:hypothetical protein